MDEFHGEKLLRAIVLKEPAVAVSVKAESVELYVDGVVLRWALPGRYEEAREEHAHVWPKLQDDVGTKNVNRGGHSGGSLRYGGEWWFVPEVPGDAARLEVRGFDYEITVPLG